METMKTLFSGEGTVCAMAGCPHADRCGVPIRECGDPDAVALLDALLAEEKCIRAEVTP